MSAYIFCHCNATLHPPFHPPSAPLQAALSVVRALSHYSSAFAATFLYHTATLAWFGLTPTPLLASAPCQSNPRPSALSLSPYAVFNSISRVTFHCMHRFIIAKMENSPAADGFPSAVASLSLSLFLFIPCLGSSSHWATHFAHFVLDGLS